jgi:hypothetical protein
MNFKDHFSKRAGIYAQYRPGYPALFQYAKPLMYGKENGLTAPPEMAAAAGLAKHLGDWRSSKNRLPTRSISKVDYGIALAETPINPNDERCCPGPLARYSQIFKK